MKKTQEEEIKEVEQESEDVKTTDVIDENIESPEQTGEEEKTATETSDEDIQMQLLAVMAENQDLNNRLLRLQADFENFKRRTRNEREELLKYANFDLIQKLLPVIDNFARALQTNEEQGDKLLQGVAMIYRQLTEILAKEGLQEIEAVGKEFDPNLHDAVMQEESDEFPDNTVMMELQKGYLYKDKLLRPSMVKVCKK